MKIAIFAQNSATQYSGGRYHSWMMAEALAQANHDVHYVTNNKPVFYDDFFMYPHHQDIHVWIRPEFWFNLPKGNFDIVVLIPSMDKNPAFYYKVLYFAEARRARLVLLNFETPNWFNSLSPVERDPSLWNNWKLASLQASLILSSSKEGDKFAKLYFNSCSTKTQFNYCYPSINNISADSVVGVKKEKRIILITRFVRAEHKGGFDATELICEAMRGYTLVLIVGSADMPPEVMNAFRSKADQHGVELDVKYRLTDREKFREIKRASLMVFPSFFEGFGLPPVEAQYCNIPCIAFDLPVLREVSGEGIIYVEPGNWSQFRSKIEEMLTSNKTYEYLQDHIARVARVECYSQNIDQVVKRITQQDEPSKSPAKRFFSALNFAFRSYISNLIGACLNLLRALWGLLWVFLLPLLVLLRPLLRSGLIRLFPETPGDNIKDEAIQCLRKLISNRRQ